MAAAAAEAPGGAVMVPRYGLYSPVIELTASNTASCTMAAYRAWAKGFCWLATAVLTAITFQSKTASVFAAADPNQTLTINTLKSLRFTGFPNIFFIVSPPSARCVRERHRRGLGTCVSIARRVSRRYVLCPAKHQDCLDLGRSFSTGVKSFNFFWAYP